MFELPGTEFMSTYLYASRKHEWRLIVILFDNDEAIILY
jgi:hypothetical protein